MSGTAGPERFVVLTGGPGSGKTTLVERLRALGYATSTEAGRAIIKGQVAIGGPLLPEHDPVAFLDAILAWELRSYREALAVPGPVFFDRGMPDVAGGFRQLDLPVPAYVDAAVAACPYARTVFVAPPWPEIYEHDAERTHTWESAVRTYDVMVAAYSGYGYDLVELPRVSVEERLTFLTARLARGGGGTYTPPSG